MPRHDAFLVEAKRLQAKYAGRIALLIGFEAEWIRPGYGALVKELAAHPAVDFFIGSVHHGTKEGIPIDFEQAYYAKAVKQAQAEAAAAGEEHGRSEDVGDDDDLAEEALWSSYYDAQYEMLRTLRPRVVGHFDLIRLFSAAPGRDVRSWAGGRVWERICRNLALVVEMGAWLECNTSGLRKGLAEPYPGRQIAEVNTPGSCSRPSL